MTILTSHLITNTVLLFTFFFSSFFLYKIVVSKNPISVIVWLIGLFFNIAFVLTLLGADYIAILILLLYAGAISIILLFVVMLLDMKDIVIYVEKYSLFIKIFYVFFLLFLNFMIFSEYFYVLDFLPRVQYVDWFKIFNMKTNIEVVGLVIFELFVFQFLFIGLSLFVVTVLIISLIINFNFISKKQHLIKQLDGAFSLNIINSLSSNALSRLIKSVDSYFSYFNSILDSKIYEQLHLYNSAKSKIILCYRGFLTKLIFFVKNYSKIVFNYFINRNVYTTRLIALYQKIIVNENVIDFIDFWKELREDFWDEVVFERNKWYWKFYRFRNNLCKLYNKYYVLFTKNVYTARLIALYQKIIVNENVIDFIDFWKELREDFWDEVVFERNKWYWKFYRFRSKFYKK